MPPALAGLQFTDVTEEAGLGNVVSSQGRQSFEAMTAGVAVADYDNDGDSDIYFTAVGHRNTFLRNEGDGTFSDVTEQIGVSGIDPAGGHSAPAFADVNGDGHLDLFMTGATRPANVLYVNDGNGKFLDETAERGLAVDIHLESGEQKLMHGSAFADVNNDGAMDLLVLEWDEGVLADIGDEALLREIASNSSKNAGSRPCRAAKAIRERGSRSETSRRRNLSALYLNSGDGHFQNVTQEYGLTLHDVVAFTGSFGDLNDDGWQDLVVTGDGCTSRLYMNDHGVRFVDVTDGSGVGTDENGMGSLLRDFDEDGDLDWFVTGIAYPTGGRRCPADSVAVGCSGNRLYSNDGKGKFRDVTEGAGVRDAGWGWGVAAESFSGLPRREIVVANGFFERLEGRSGANLRYFSTFTEDPLRFWVPSGERYVDLAKEVGLDDRDPSGPQNGSRAVVPFDYDNDGDLDLLLTRAGASPRLFRNDRPPTSHWVSIVLEQPGLGNRFAEGAKVEVKVDAKSKPRSVWISSNGSYDSQVLPEAYFGLGPEGPATIHELRVWWPTPTGRSEPTVLREVAADRRIVVRRP